MSSDSSQAADLELQFKKRARRRLVGAVALVLVMLVVLPMILDDHEHNVPQQAVTISIPSQNAEFTTQAPLKAPEPAPVKVTPNPIAENPVVETPTVVEQPKPEVKPISNPITPHVVKELSEKKPTEAKKPVEVKKAEETKKVDDKKDKTATESSDKSVSDKTVKAKPNTTDKVNAADKPVAEAKAPDDSGRPYYLQIGVFSDSVNVVQLQKKLSELKLKAYTEKIATDKGDKTRLRVGPFDNKDQADHAAEKVKTIGLSGFVSNK